MYARRRPFFVGLRFHVQEGVRYEEEGEEKGGRDRLSQELQG